MPTIVLTADATVYRQAHHLMACSPNYTVALPAAGHSISLHLMLNVTQKSAQYVNFSDMVLTLAVEVIRIDNHH